MLHDVNPDPATLNPVDEVNVLAADLFYDGLTRYRSESRSLEPGLAASWSSDDGVHWKFNLDRRRRFSDGSLVTSKSVVESLTRVASKHASSLGASRLAIISGFSEFVAGTAPTITGLAAPDIWTVTVETTAVNFELPALMADPTYGVVADPAATISSVATAGVTSGPLKVGRVGVGGGNGGFDLEPLDASQLTISGVQFVRFATESAAVSALRTGRVDVAPLPDRVAAPVGSTERLVSAATLELSLGATNPHWTAEANRKAVANGLDRFAVAKAVTGDSADVMDRLAPTGVFVPSDCAAGCRPTKTQLGALAGLGASIGKVRIDLLDQPDSQAAAEAVATQLRTAGFEVELHSGSAQELAATLTGGTLDVMLYGAIGLAPTPDPYLAESLATDGRENLVGLSSQEFDKAVAAARGTADPAKRSDAYEALNQQALELGASVPLVRLGQRYGIADRLRRADPALGVLFDGRQIRFW